MHKWDAPDYQKNSEVQLIWGRELIAKLALQGNEHILDIGCGDGKVTAEIATHVPHGRVVGRHNGKNTSRGSFLRITSSARLNTAAG